MPPPAATVASPSPGVPVPASPAHDRVAAISQLALDFVRKLMPPAQACERNGFTPAEATALLKNPNFQALMKQFKAEWLDSGNSVERARLQAGAALEDGISQLYRMMHGDGGGPDGKLSAVQVEAVKAMARIAGIGGVASGMGSAPGIPGAPGAAQGLKLIFNFSNAAPQVIEGAVSAQTLQDLEAEKMDTDDDG